MVEGAKKAPRGLERMDLIVVENDAGQIGAQKVAQRPSGFQSRNCELINGAVGGKQMQLIAADKRRAAALFRMRQLYEARTDVSEHRLQLSLDAVRWDARCVIGRDPSVTEPLPYGRGSESMLSLRAPVTEPRKGAAPTLICRNLW
jgi:hypothetical protein